MGREGEGDVVQSMHAVPSSSCSHLIATSQAASATALGEVRASCCLIYERHCLVHVRLGLPLPAGHDEREHPTGAAVVPVGPLFGRRFCRRERARELQRCQYALCLLPAQTSRAAFIIYTAGLL